MLLLPFLECFEDAHLATHVHCQRDGQHHVHHLEHQQANAHTSNGNDVIIDDIPHPGQAALCVDAHHVALWGTGKSSITSLKSGLVCCCLYRASNIQGPVPTLYIDHLSIFLQRASKPHPLLPHPQVQIAAYQCAAGEGHAASLEGYTAAVEVNVALPVVGLIDPTAPD